MIFPIITQIFPKRITLAVLFFLFSSLRLFYFFRMCIVSLKNHKRVFHRRSGREGVAASVAEEVVGVPP